MLRDPVKIAEMRVRARAHDHRARIETHELARRITHQMGVIAWADTDLETGSSIVRCYCTQCGQPMRVILGLPGEYECDRCYSEALCEAGV